MPRAVVQSLLCLAVSSGPLAAQQAIIRNADFEDATPEGAPVGWSVPGAGYSAQVVRGEGVGGGAALRLRRETPDGATGGAIAQSIDATPYRGKRVRLIARARAVTFTGGWAGLWLREDRIGGVTGFFDNMQGRPIGSNQWRTYEIVGDIGADAERLMLGLLLNGQGVAWLDVLELEVIGNAPPAVVEPPRALTRRGLENVVAFSRLLGYVRYFHPSDAAADAHWEWLAVDGMRRVEGAADARELVRALDAVFRPLAPGLELTIGTPPAGVDGTAGRGSTVGDSTVGGSTVGGSTLGGSTVGGRAVGSSTHAMAWRHHGVGIGPAHPVYRSTRLRLPVTSSLFGDSLPAIGEQIVADLGGGVVASIPFTVLVDDVTAPATSSESRSPRPGHPPEPLPTAGAFTAADRATRLAAVAIAWNVFQHFYPYFDVVATDWAAELPRALAAAATDEDALSFLATSRTLVAALHDGHGSVQHAADVRTHVPPIAWADVDGRPVITVAGADAGVERGDLVLSIDGRPAADVIADAERLTSGATPQWRRFAALRSLLAGPPDSELVIGVLRARNESRRAAEAASGADLAASSADGVGTRTITLRRSVRAPGPAEPRPEPIAELRPGILYVDLDRVTDAQFSDALPRLAAADGLVFDMRGYPSQVNAAIVLSHLLTEPGTSAQWHIPVTTRPDRTDMQFMRGGEWNLQPRVPHLSAPRVFLTDGRAVSYAESVMGIVEHYRLGEIVGGPTAGTNGNVNPFTLPGGYRVSWTGMKVLKHDGSVHHGVGILPTVPVSRTVEGVAAGRDELLERALQLLEARR
jgi:C-terminal processing protease CtpA/Prc